MVIVNNLPEILYQRRLKPYDVWRLCEEKGERLSLPSVYKALKNPLPLTANIGTVGRVIYVLGLSVSDVIEFRNGGREALLEQGLAKLVEDK